MATTLNIPNCDVTIMARIVQPEKGDLSLAAARAFLKFAFVQSDHDRMDALMERAHAGTLTKEENNEMDDYERVGHLLGMMYSKARMALKKHVRVSK